MHRNQGVYVWVRIDPMNKFCVFQKIRPDCVQVLLEGTRAEWRPVGATAELSIGVRYAQDAVGGPPRSNDASSFFCLLSHLDRCRGLAVVRACYYGAVGRGRSV